MCLKDECPVSSCKLVLPAANTCPHVTPRQARRGREDPITAFHSGCYSTLCCSIIDIFYTLSRFRGHCMPPDHNSRVSASAMSRSLRNFRMISDLISAILLDCSWPLATDLRRVISSRCGHLCGLQPLLVT